MTTGKTRTLAKGPLLAKWSLCFLIHCVDFSSLVAQRLKCLPAMWESWVWPLGREDPLEKEMATHSSILAWRIPWAEEPGGLQSMGLQRVGHDWATSLFTFLQNFKPLLLKSVFNESIVYCIHLEKIFKNDFMSYNKCHIDMSYKLYYTKFGTHFII